MAGITLKIGIHVCRSFALCLDIVMAGRTTAAHFGMIKVDRRIPTQRRMATIASI